MTVARPFDPWGAVTAGRRRRSFKRRANPLCLPQWAGMAVARPTILVTTFLVIIAVAINLAVPTSAHAQVTTAPPAEPSLRTFFPDLASDVRRLPSNAAGVSMALGGILSTAFSPFDDETAAWDPEGSFTLGTVFNGATLAAITLGTYGVAHWTRSPKTAHVAIDVFRAQVFALALTYALKYTVQRERPDHSSNDSFPSGHSSQVFASATVIARHIGPNAAWPALAAATFVAVSRVNQQRHFISDVLFGAGLGVAVGWNSGHTAPWRVTPLVSPTAIGVVATRRAR